MANEFIAKKGLIVESTTESTSKTIGSLVVAGGAGIGKNLNIGGNLQIDGNFVVGGTTTTLNTQTLAITDNLIYLNNGIVVTITNASGNGTTVTYTYTSSSPITAGMDITITGVNPTVYNLVNATIATLIGSTQFTVTSSVTGAFVSGGTGKAQAESNADLGFVGGYYDTAYKHAGFFRDASDSGIWKIFDGYTSEPDGAVNLDTNFATSGFTLANIQANSFIGSLTGNASTATTANTLTTARNISGVSFNGSADITLSTTGITEGTNLYYLDSRARAAHSLTTTGNSGAATYSSSTGVLNVPTYTLAGLGGEPTITAGTTSQYWRGDKSWQTLNTTAVTEGTNLYYTDTRARAAHSFVAGSGAYNSTTGVITIPTNTNQLTNGAGFITGNQSINLTGDITGTGTTSISSTIANSAVTLAKMANLTANTIIGNNTGSAATPLALTGTQVTAMLDNFTSTTKGLVPLSGGGTTNFLRADGSWAAPAGGGGSTSLTFNRRTVTTDPGNAYTLQLTDAGKVIEMNFTAENVVVIPENTVAAIPIGSEIIITQYGTGQVSIIGGGGGAVLIRSTASNTVIAYQFAAVTLVKIAANEWYAYGGFVRPSDPIVLKMINPLTTIATTSHQDYIPMTELAISLAPSTAYKFKLVIFYSVAATTTGIRINFKKNTTVTDFRFISISPITATALGSAQGGPVTNITGAAAAATPYRNTGVGTGFYTTATASLNSGLANTLNMATTEGVIVNLSTSDVLTPLFASEVAAQVSVSAYSYIEYSVI